MVVTRRSTRSRTKAHGTELGEESKQQPCAPAQLELERAERDSDSLLDQLTEKVFERLTKQQETASSCSKTAPHEVLELTGGPEDPFQLASSLQPQLEETPYFTQKTLEVSVSATGTKKGCSSSSLCESEVDKLLKKTVITSDFERQDGVPSLRGPSKYARKKANQVARLSSAGKDWFDMPAPQLTPQLKNDLRLLRMRNALDPSHHYKANDSKKLPRYFQVGRVVSGPGEFYSSRIPRRQQKQSLVEELLSNEEARTYHKKKYLELQEKFSSGTRRWRNIKHKKQFRK